MNKRLPITDSFLLYGANGFLGQAIAKMAIDQGLKPILAGRNAYQIRSIANDLDLQHRIFSLDDPDAVDSALGEVEVILHCAGPYSHTYETVVAGCLRTGTHYLDLTGEIMVYEAIAKCDSEAKANQVMLLPGVGFDVVPTDCLAMHLQRRVPTASHLTIGFFSDGLAGLPPGTVNTFLELIPFGIRARQKGRLVNAPRGGKTRLIDFGFGPRKASLLTWGDLFTAYHSTGIQNIEDYTVFPGPVVTAFKVLDYLRPLFSVKATQKLLKPLIPSGSTPEERASTKMHVWAEVQDAQGRKAAARLHGPEGSVIWTAMAALAVVKKVLAGDVKPGYQTPALAYGPEFGLEMDGITLEDLP